MGSVSLFLFSFFFLFLSSPLLSFVHKSTAIVRIRVHPLSTSTNKHTLRIKERRTAPMAKDDFLICEVVLGVVFGAFFVTIVGLGVYNCLQRRNHMLMLEAECVKLDAMAEEKQQKLNWLTSVTDLADNGDLFLDDVSSNMSFNSRGSRASNAVQL